MNTRRPVQSVICLLALSLLLCNILNLTRLYKKIAKLNETLPFTLPGREFNDFQQPLDGITKAGFLTDKDMSPEKNDGMFLKAQYALAPLVLELGNAQHTYLILDYQNYLSALEAMQRYDAVPLAMNSYGKILAQRRQP